jgi:dTMP kinase
MIGKFITAEGTDGSGKSTQLEKLKTYLHSLKIKTLFVREPGGTDISEKIRSLLLDISNSDMAYETEALLYAASRAQLMKEKIIPALESGTFVICDRFVDSSYVYQGYARGLDLKMVEEINKYATFGIMPDITLFFDIAPEKSIERVKKCKVFDRIEREKLDFHKKVYNGYIELSKKYPRVKRIDASQGIDETFEQVKKYVDIIIGENNE